MMRITTLLVLSLSLIGCTLLQQPRTVELDPNAEVRVAVKLVENSIKIIKDKNNDDYGWKAEFTFEESSEACDSVVSEIWLEDGYYLVETFKTPGGALPAFQRDTHFRSNFNDAIIFVYTYPAVVEGADYTYAGFAMLAENRDGSMKSNVGANFNRKYQKGHPNWKKQGRIVKDERKNGIWWAEEMKDGKLNIFIPSNPKIVLP